MVQALAQHLMSVLDAVLYGTTGNAIAVVFPPLCYMAPRVLLKSLRHLSTQSSSTFTLQRLGSGRFNSSTPHNNILYPNPPNTPHAKALNHTQQSKESMIIAGEERAKLLRSIVSCQQSLTLLFESRYIGTYKHCDSHSYIIHACVHKYIELLSNYLPHY